MTPTEKEPESVPRRLTMESILPGVQVGLLLLVVPLVGWVSALQLAPLQLSIDGVKEDVSDLREEFRKVDQRIDDLAGRGPNETVMALISALQQRVEKLEKP